MEKTENKMSINYFIDHYGVENILNRINDIDIVNHLDDWMLKMVNDEELVKAINDKKLILDSMDIDDICDFLETNGYVVIDKQDVVDNIIIAKIKNICREIRPKGYIDKEDAKKIICEYIDNWFVKAF